MDRYNDVKIQLKTWEQGFVTDHQRKPNKEDIDQAADETRNLYKEYRSLKQAKDNSSSDAASGHVEQARSTAAVNTPQKDCWGSHLNRSSQPAPSPKLTAEERDNLQASAQYYGMKLKNNMGTLGKERPVSLKKSFLPGRVPLNSLKDGLTGQTNSPVATPVKNPFNGPRSSPFTPRRFNTPQGLASKTPQKAEPEEPCEPFESVKDSCEKPASAAISYSSPSVLSSKSCTSKVISSQNQNISHLAPSPARSASLLSSLSSPSRLGTLRGDVGATGKLNESIGALGDKEEHVDNFRTPHKVDDEAGVGALISLRGGPQVIAGFRGGMAGKPSPASRLSFVDKKWLERCQVFGEMGAEVKPGAGNVEIDVEKRGECEEGRETTFKTDEEEKSGKEEIHVAEERRAAKVSGEVKEPKSITHDKTVSESEPEPSLQHTGKSHQRKRKGKAKEKEDIEEMERGPTPPLTPEEDNEESNKSKGGKKKGKKRQREAEHMDAEAPEEGGVKKRRRNGKKKEESSDGKPSTAPQGGRKKRSKKKGDEDEEAEEEKKTKEPTKLPQENLLGEIEEDYKARKAYKTQPAKVKGMKGAEGNFVKINLKKKSHVKGYALRGAGLRKQIYMEKFQLKGERFGGHGFLSRGGGGGFRGGGHRGGFRGGMSQSGDTCYKCGGTGHWAIHCKGPAPPPSAAEDQAAEEEPFDLPTLEEVARATGTLQPQPMAASSSAAEEQPSQDKQGDGNTKDEVLLNVIRPDYECPVVPPPMEPMFPLTDDGKVQEAPPELYEALKELGYRSFRPGQAEAIMRILSGLSTLVVLSTGMGKSLCYQLPAYMYAKRSNSITLVISPLVSLMDDQVSGLPANLKAACIHSNMSKKQREAAIEKWMMPRTSDLSRPMPNATVATTSRSSPHMKLFWTRRRSEEDKPAWITPCRQVLSSAEMRVVSSLRVQQVQVRRHCRRSDCDAVFIVDVQMSCDVHSSGKCGRSCLETLLCYLELHPQRFVELLHPTLSVCKIGCYSGPKQLQKLTKICPPIAVVLARRRMAGERVETCDQLEFDVVEVADTMGWQLSLVKRGLRQLQWSSVGGRSGVSVELSSISFYFRSFGDLSDEEMDRVCQFLYNRVQNQEKTQIYQLTSSFKAFKSVAFPSASSCVDDLDESRSLRLKDLLSDYFDKRRDLSQMLAPVYIEELDKYKFSDWENQIRADIRSFLSNRSDEKFSGRAVARILHGIGSPCFPAQIYGRDRRYWRKYIQFDFNQLIRLATQEIIHFK
ncbi:ATP-dependent DNA helicase Q4 [Notothenia coriiceps]|uniref:ATP-dependent DNA helicase Q4 n=1 Tax=Notothenia coriiceps TaxID=8208 RepID=A0A6I9PX51_9TELE|nr:PREDICTED: ATP-dependent DNA helicase Q4 [Notothenia coriiceps]